MDPISSFTSSFKNRSFGVLVLLLPPEGDHVLYLVAICFKFPLIDVLLNSFKVFLTVFIAIHGFEPSLIMAVSSANIARYVLLVAGMSLMYMLNNVGLSELPCGR